MSFDYTGGIKDLYCCPQPVGNLDILALGTLGRSIFAEDQWKSHTSKHTWTFWLMRCNPSDTNNFLPITSNTQTDTADVNMIWFSTRNFVRGSIVWGMWETTAVWTSTRKQQRRQTWIPFSQAVTLINIASSCSLFPFPCSWIMLDGAKGIVPHLGNTPSSRTA